MNESYKTTGIIIGKRDFFESDKILTVFTKDLGKIKVKARGLRKILAKMAGHLEMFNYSKLELIKGKNFYIVIGAQTIDSHSFLKEDFDKIGVLYYICEILDKVLEEDVRHKNTFNFLLSVIEKLKDKEANFPLLIIFLELNILSILGFKPEFLVCVGCRGNIFGHNFYFNINRGGVLCKSCGDKDIFSDPVSIEAINLMRSLAKQNYDLIHDKADQKVIREVKKINTYFLEHILDKELKSKNFLNISKPSQGISNED